jgi:hypothetical protein
VDLVTIPYSRLDVGNELARAYLVEPERVLPLFGADYRDPRTFEPKETPRAPFGLVEYNRAVGGSVENAERIERGVACVISGQQAGLLYGPAYTTYKFLTVINLARTLGEELKAPVVPVFWVESEDHDWAEVNRFFLDGRRLALDVAVEPGTPVSGIEADPSAFLEEVRSHLGDGEAWSRVEPDRNVARWHVKNLARLVPDSGVVFVEPHLLRDAARDVAGRIAAAPDVLDASLGIETGFEKALQPPRGAYLFDSSGPRRRLERGAALPDKWSGDVASRVLIQNAVFQPLAAVCGPGEIHYWAQLKQAHEALDIPMPVVFPRDTATLVEPGASRNAAKLGLALDDIVCGETVLPHPDADDPIAERLRRLAGEAQSLIAAVEDGSLDLPADASKPFKRTVGRLEADLDRLASRVDAARADAEGVGRKRYDKLLTMLRPRDRLQERTSSLFPYLVRHGPDLAVRLMEAFDPYEFGHYLVML